MKPGSLKIGDYVLFSSQKQFPEEKIMGRIVAFDDEGDPGILPYGWEGKKDNPWYRFTDEIKKLSEEEAMLFVLEIS